MILRFLEVYCDSLEFSQPLIEIWPQCLAYIKDYIAQASSYKYLFPSLLRYEIVVQCVLKLNYDIYT
jgi:hypothetical protein